MLKRDEILFLLKLLGEETVQEPTEKFPFRISREGRGYSSDKKVGSLQAKLSIMLEMASGKEA